MVHLSDFDFSLPEDLIALHPASPRDSSRLLVVNRCTGTIDHRHFLDLVDYVTPGDVLVLNQTRVIPARLLTTDKSGRAFEILLLREKENYWDCLLRPTKKLRGDTLFLKDGSSIEVRRVGEGFGVYFEPRSNFSGWLSTVGEPPLPPYIKRKSEPSDHIQYQTVYAKDWGSVAAPTAGLHFTDSLLSQVKDKGVKIASLTLHMGYGTFAPIRSESVSEHKMHFESYDIPDSTLSCIDDAKREKRRVIPVGTTSLRSLESIPQFSCRGETNLFIVPGFHFRYADSLITNFHLPKSSLFILVCAFLGRELALRCYVEAIERRYRFYSYGDAMLIV